MVDCQGHFVWYELATTDVDAARAFYTKIIGWGAEHATVQSMGYGLFTADGAAVCGFVSLSEDARKIGAKPHWIGYVGVDDVDASADLVKKLGGAVHVSPTNFSNLSRFALVADPQTAIFGLISWATPGQDRQPELKTPGRIGWHELLADDRERAFAFYGTLLGWQRARTTVGPMGTYQLFSAGDQAIGGMLTKPRTVSVPFWIYYFNVSDIDMAAKRVKAGGGQILEGPIQVPDGSWVLHCSDPQGAIFALVGQRQYKAVVRLMPFNASTTSGTQLANKLK